jgi:hypothetical protein
MQSKNKNSLSTKAIVSEIILQLLHDMQNGSITIIKQDNTVIQVNIHQKTCFGKQVITDDLVEGILS